MTAFTLGPQFEPQTDLIAAALSVPLHAVTKEHVGRKLRLMVQIIDVDATGTHALVTAAAGATRRPTLVVNLTTALLGHSPGATPSAQVAYDPGPAAASTLAAAGASRPLAPAAHVPRQRLSLAHGEWVCVVGWLEESAVPEEVCAPPGFAAPPFAVLEAIFVSPARAPPPEVVFRGEVA